MYRDKSGIIDCNTGGEFTSLPVTAFNPILVRNLQSGSGVATILGSVDGVTFEELDALSTDYDLSKTVEISVNNFLYYRIVVLPGGSGLAEFELEQGSKRIGESRSNFITVPSNPVVNHSEINLDDGTNPHGTTAEDVGAPSGSGSSTGTNTGDEHIYFVQSTASSPADAQTVYFGNLPKGLVTTAGISKVYIKKTGIIHAAEIYCYSGTAGTAENWSMYLRVNNTTDHLIKTIGSATNERLFNNDSLNIPVVAGDFFEIKLINPTWATNPLSTSFGGNIFVN